MSPWPVLDLFAGFAVGKGPDHIDYPRSYGVCSYVYVNKWNENIKARLIGFFDVTYINKKQGLGGETS